MPGKIEPTKLLFNLLSRIFNDTGQYIGEHGIEKAYEDAMPMLTLLQSKLAILRLLINEHKNTVSLEMLSEILEAESVCIVSERLHGLLEVLKFCRLRDGTQHAASGDIKAV